MVGAKCLVMTDQWGPGEHFKVVGVDEDMISLRPFLDFIDSEPERKISRSEARDILFLTPYARYVAENYPAYHYIGKVIENLSGSWLRTQPRYPIGELIDKLNEDERLQNIPRRFIEGCLRSLVMSEAFVVWHDKRLNEPVYHLELSQYMAEKERLRMYAGTFAGELNELSNRVRHLISHSGTVGTYRENLLQTLLRKNIPERYHVATGFIHQCPRQLDILIYDRIDYAPLFREGDLVVVPKESVRAVIEVKTTINKAELIKSLELLDQVAVYDNCKPPFFRGIFGFESTLSGKDIYSTVLDFYTEPSDDGEIEGLIDNAINEPFKHVSSICVLEHAYACVDYVSDESEQIIPVLMAADSATGLMPQAAYFLQQLLSYLRFGGIKPNKRQYMAEFLGADTTWKNVGSLIPFDSWGAYFVQQEMGGDEKIVEEFESQINAVNGWLQGEPWQGEA